MNADGKQVVIRVHRRLSAAQNGFPGFFGARLAHPV
jgi:hypothetical protein